ncbi:sulfite exporter TauE/SafE family protein [Desertibacillus haloalkaliphilus]|uniref:sulfite exporter TauE/SafE family protein n=1 Tax=Desertibacillus haloalkaliphilus TaxID=1328930 RepID=UPI001C26DEFF|nr:sulfite exporter TauE/SafE family protein [Desertibacillus haloalkaliphilus]MBU8906587.1 sulfite exporter TauE/SafE family protein [Desertibacillus haloalkaliphilus]
MEWVLLVIIGLAAGTLGSLMGLGGGIIIVPALMVLSGYTAILSGMTPQVAVGTSLLIMIFTGLSSTLAYIKQKKVDYRSGLLFFIGSGPGAIFGVWLNKDINVDTFLVYFGIFIVFVSFVLMVRKHLKPLKIRQKGIKRTYINESGEEIEYGYQPVLAIAISFVVGMFSGLFGIGGGSLMVPAMILLFGFPAHTAVATSMFMIFLSSIVSSISHISLGNVDWLYALALVPGAWFGGKLGAYINQRLANDTVVHLLRLMLIIIGVRLIWQGITG